MSQANLEVRRISGHAGAVPGVGLKRELEVAKLIDTTTCIGCKACEVACLEWNGLSFSDTTFDNSYQTMPETAWNFWNLIKFNEYEPADGGLMLLMRKDQCMHCEEPGCLDRLPGRRRHRAVRQRHRRLPAGPVHRLRLLHHRLPVQHPEVQPGHRARCSSARSARTASPRGWSPPASRRAPPAACTSAPRTR